MLQRGARSIIAFDASTTPLANASAWDAASAPPAAGQIDASVAALFGYDLDGADDLGQFVAKNQLFPTAAFAPFVGTDADWAAYLERLAAPRTWGDGQRGRPEASSHGRIPAPLDARRGSVVHAQATRSRSRPPAPR